MIDRVVLPGLRSAASDQGTRMAPDSSPKAAAPTGTPRLTGPPSPTLPASPPPLVRYYRPRAKATPTTRPRPARTPPSAPAQAGGGAAGSGVEGAVVRISNQERAKAGCPALRSDTRLALAARRHSADMVAKGYFSHDSQDGTSPWTRMAAAGYSSPGAENIAKGQPTAAAVMKSWMDSPGHRANILNCTLRAIGVGMRSGSGGPVWTQDFGRA